MADFLLEIGTEEMPSWMIPMLAEELAAKLEEKLAGRKLKFESVRKFGAPRRLGVLVHSLSGKQEDSRETLFGPPLSVAKNEKEEWTAAATGFAKKNNLKIDELKILEGPKGKVIGAVAERKGRNAADILSEDIPAIVDSLYLPKAMKWGEGEHLFVRPVKWVLSLLDKKVVPMEIKGVKSSKETRGHRIFGAERVAVESAASYFEKLKKEHVIADIEERKKIIVMGLDDLAASVEGDWKDGRKETEELLASVLFLSEYPSVILGEIPEDFLSLPTPVLSTCLREHQKFFSVYKKDDGNVSGILPYILAVCDGPRTPGETKAILEGLKNVTLARLQDARFFYEHDKVVKLEKRLEDLKGIIFHPKIGSYYEKARRMERYARELAPHFSQDPGIAARAALLSKCDLASLLVQEKEFTSLQGVAGGLYAEAQGEDNRISRAISEHYGPVPDEIKGTNPCSLIVAIADRFDTLMEFFKINETPSGSKDPFGIRRAGRMIVEILATADFYKGIPKPGCSLEEMVTRWYGKECPAIVDFLRERFRHLLSSEKNEKGEALFQHDEIEAVVTLPLADLLDLKDRLVALSMVRNEHREDFDALSVAFKRAKNILKGMPHYRLDPLKFMPENSNEGASERALHRAYIQVKDKAEDELKKKNYTESLGVLATIRPQVDAFFDNVLVMTDPEGKDASKTALQENRLALLERLTKLFYRICDFSEIVPRES